MYRSVGLRRAQVGGGGSEPTWGDCLESGLTGFTVNNGSTAAQEGYRFTVGASDIRVCALKYRNPTSGSSEVTLRLWAATGTVLLASKTHTPVSSTDAWNTVTLDAPVVLEAGKTYAVTGRRTNGTSDPRRYAFTSSMSFHPAITLNTGVVVSGDGYPSGGQAWCRLVDIVFAELL